MNQSYFLGIDASTQGVKALVIDADNAEIVAEAAVNFGKDLPQFGAPNGHIETLAPAEFHADPRMWVAGCELCLKRLASQCDLAQVRGVSGSGQQHGSVYLDDNGGFSRDTSPIWMDNSTGTECAELEAKFGALIREATGSPATERFTGPQIRRFHKTDSNAYARTRVIHLVSSFFCSKLIGADAPIDFGDGAGMNLLDLRTMKWNAEIAAFTAPDLLAKLPPVAPSDTIAGGLAAEFEKYGLKAGTPVVVWSGDNPNSLVGVGASSPGTAVISLGTSDTVFAALESYAPQRYGHIFGNPAGGFMSLVCFTNGSLAREKVREECGVDWAYFDNAALAETEFGNGGKIFLPWYQPETTPLVSEARPRANFDASAATPAERIRAVLETQALTMRHHTPARERPRVIRVTGGASRSNGFLRILADVFQARVETISAPNSAALGAAMRAANAVAHIPFAELNARFCRPVATIEPNAALAAQADKMLAAFGDFVKI